MKMEKKYPVEHYGRF